MAHAGHARLSRVRDDTSDADHYFTPDVRSLVDLASVKVTRAM